MRTSIIIPARGGSKGVPGKNVMQLLGKPLIGWVIEAALAAKDVINVSVSSDDEEILEVSSKWPVTCIKRPDHMANDEAPIDPTLRHGVEVIEGSHGKIDSLVWLQANVPTTTTKMIDQAIATKKTTQCDSVQTVVPYGIPPQWAWRIDEEGAMHPLEGVYSYTVLRQQANKAFHLDGSVMVLDRDILMETEGCGGQAYFGKNRHAIMLDRHESIEIDEPFDFELAKLILKNRHSG